MLTGSKEQTTNTTVRLPTKIAYIASETSRVIEYIMETLQYMDGLKKDHTVPNKTKRQISRQVQYVLHTRIQKWVLNNIIPERLDDTIQELLHVGVILYIRAIKTDKISNTADDNRRREACALIAAIIKDTIHDKWIEQYGKTPEVETKYMTLYHNILKQYCTTIPAFLIKKNRIKPFSRFSLWNTA